MSIARATAEDPRGVIAESYHISDLSLEDFRSIFMEWAMIDNVDDKSSAMKKLLARFQVDFPEHHMTRLLKEGLLAQDNETTKTRRGGRNARLARQG